MLPDSKGLIALTCHSFTGFIHSKSQSDRSDDSDKNRGLYKNYMYSPEEQYQVAMLGATPTKAKQNVLVKVTASNAVSSLIIFHF